MGRLREALLYGMFYQARHLLMVSKHIGSFLIGDELGDGSLESVILCLPNSLLSPILFGTQGPIDHLDL